MDKFEISAVGHQNLSSIFKLCSAEGNHETKHSQMNNKVPKVQLTLTLGRPREREREERGGYPGPWGGRRRGWPADEGAPAAGEGANGGGGGGSKGGGSSGEG
jgi:hypothetical protein